jgi:hypothetical protein
MRPADADPISSGWPKGCSSLPGDVRSKGALSNKTAVATIFRLAEADESQSQLPNVIFGVTFTDGIEGLISQA